MRAIVIRQFGGPEVLSIEERPAPEPRPGHVLIERRDRRKYSASNRSRRRIG